MDVSAVPLQGAYIARRCPVRAQNDVLQPGVPDPPSPLDMRMLRRGKEFEGNLLTAIAYRDIAFISTGDDAVSNTVAAMRSRAAVILGGALPPDEQGRRIGRPDILVAGASGYRPLEIKSHRTLQSVDPPQDGDDSVYARVCSLSRPWLEDALYATGFVARRLESDCLQLAHYQRMLEACGMAAHDGRLAGVIGTENSIVWHDLDQPVWRTPSLSEGMKLRSAMERYDFEFGFRLDIIAVAQAHLLDPSVELLVKPVRCSECPSCPWRSTCRQQLEVGWGDPSLLPGVHWRHWKAHRDRGVTDRHGVAALDPWTGALISAIPEIADLRDLTSSLDPATNLESLPHIARKPALLARLTEAGLQRVGDFRDLHPATLGYARSGMTNLATQIDDARAVLGPDPMYRRRGLASISVPRADIEVDVDMENAENGCYLWGALVTYRASVPPEGFLPQPGYHVFAVWDPLTPELEAGNGLAFWAWFTGIQSKATTAGLSFLAYCYNANAENQYLYRMAKMKGILDEVKLFTSSPAWVDLLKLVNVHLVSGASMGLKKIAPIAGHCWSVDDPGGGESMLKYDIAVSRDLQSRAAARQWLVEYNRGDCEATLKVRDWLDGSKDMIPPIDSLDHLWPKQTCQSTSDGPTASV
jgi:predicted RecB family nuclease